MRFLLSTLALLPLPALADAPQVVTDIAPVHSLVSRVMEGVGTPSLLTDQGASPHGFQLRPSQARDLDQADLLVWIGPKLTPWLERAQEGLTPEHSLVLLNAPGTVQRDFAAGNTAEDAHDDHAHEEDHGHDEDPEDDHGHDHAGFDPHAWMDPANGQAWLAVIADELAKIDPDNAATYRANAAAASAELETLTSDIQAQLSAASLPAMVTAHQAYGHFADRFDVPILGYVSLSDASAPSAAHLKELTAELGAAQEVCLFLEPQLSKASGEALAADHDLHLSILDPLGSLQEPGPTLYPALLKALADGFANCAK